MSGTSFVSCRHCQECFGIAGFWGDGYWESDKVCPKCGRQQNIDSELITRDQRELEAESERRYQRAILPIKIQAYGMKAIYEEYLANHPIDDYSI